MLRIVWEFVAKEGRIADFEKAYGPDGVWAKFFRQGRGYRRTELHKVTGAFRTYTTTDVWDAKKDFETFKREFAEEYAVIDVKCEDLTEKETCIGYFEDAGADDE